MCQKANESEKIISIPPYVDPELLEIWVEILGFDRVKTFVTEFFEATGVKEVGKLTFTEDDDANDDDYDSNSCQSFNNFIIEYDNDVKNFFECLAAVICTYNCQCEICEYCASEDSNGDAE